MKAPFRDYVLGCVRISGKTVDEIARISGIHPATLYRQIRQPDTLTRETIRVLHRYVGISYEDLCERR